MPEPTPFSLTTPSGHTLDGRVHLPEGRWGGRRPAVVICHGFKGFMDWGFFPHLATLLAERGFVAVPFNFSGSGMRPGEDGVTDFESFRENTFGREQEDLRTVLAAVGSELAPDRADPERLGLFGHSRGGGAAILTAAAERWRPSVRALVTWASVATFDRLGEEEVAAWRREGVYRVVNSRTGQELEMGLGLLEELEAEPEALDVAAAAARVQAPWLIVHGTADESVPANEARRLHRVAGEGEAEEVELLEIEDAGHTFGAVHPFAGPTPHLTRALNATQRWLRRHLDPAG